MLSESFIASTLSSEASTKPSVAKDEGIYIQGFQPKAAVKSTFKKSSTHPNCLAVSATHIFAAQAEKAVVHVYSRERNNQEATVPFPERIESVAFAGDNGGSGILVLGTQGGRVIVWEVCTGRQVSTPASHLQPVTAVAVEPACNFLLSGSEDSNVHVWSLVSLLSFSDPSRTALSTSTQISPVHSLTNHRASITSLVTGHSSFFSNIAISASKDQSCMVWDYHTGDLLRTFLLTAPPICLALDPCDRAFYAGHEDGSVQFVNFFGDSAPVTNPVHDPKYRSRATQPSASDLWAVPSLNLGAALCLDVVYEGNYIFSGHQTGKICQWDVASGKFVKELADYGAPVTNLQALPVTGFQNGPTPTLKASQVVKPRYDPSFSAGSDPGNGMAPASYTLNVQFTSSLPQLESEPGSSMQLLEAALTQASFPPSFLANSLAELTAFKSQTKPGTGGGADTSGPEAEQVKSRVADLELELENLRATHKQTWKKMVEMRMEKIQSKKEKRASLQRRTQRAHRGKRKRQGGGEDSSLNEDSSEEVGFDQTVDLSSPESDVDDDDEDRRDTVMLENGQAGKHDQEMQL